MLLDTTKTPITYRDRITIEFLLNAFSWSLNSMLIVFLRQRPHLWAPYQATIVFVSIATCLLNIPLLAFQCSMVVRLQLQHEPEYSIAFCSALKHLCSAAVSAYQVLPFAVSLHRYRIVILKEHSTVHFVVGIQIVVTVFFITIAFLNFPLGFNISNAVCSTLRFSNFMEGIRIFSTLLFNLISILINFLIFRFVRNFESDNKCLHTNRIELTTSLLAQSFVPVIISLPLLLGSLEFFFGIPLPASFSTTWYAATFFGPFLIPLSSIIGIPSIRRDLLNFCNRKSTKSSIITIVVKSQPTKIIHDFVK